jgi:NADP-dependent 3-hydroxy acid dehydrogenase YdfG
MDRFTDRKVIVTGAGSGIGQATVGRLLDEGAADDGAFITGTEIRVDGGAHA